MSLSSYSRPIPVLMNDELREQLRTSSHLLLMLPWNIKFCVTMCLQGYVLYSGHFTTLSKLQQSHSSQWKDNCGWQDRNSCIIICLIYGCSLKNGFGNVVTQSHIERENFGLQYVFRFVFLSTLTILLGHLWHRWYGNHRPVTLRSKEFTTICLYFKFIPPPPLCYARHAYRINNKKGGK
jgi:hypothetical protein